MGNYVDGKALRKLYLGIEVPRATENVAIVATPGSPIYDVVGLVLVTGLLGVCTTTHGGAANNMFLEFNPDLAASATSDITATADIGTTAVAGDVGVVVGAPATALLVGHVALNVLGSTGGQGIVFNDGVIGLTADAANGAWRWIIFYIPLDDGAYIVAL